MPPSAFNKMEGNPDTHWEALTEARAIYLNGGVAAESSGGMGQALLIGGGALLALICIALALLVG